MTVTSTGRTDKGEAPDPTELLIREARAASLRRRLRALAVVIAVIFVTLTGLFVVGKHGPARRLSTAVNEQSQVAWSVCTNWKTTAESSVTVIGAYPTTVENFESWSLTIDPLAGSGALKGLSPSADITDCVFRGSWDLPSQTGNGDVNYEAVVVTHEGTGIPMVWGPSNITKSATTD